MKQYQVQHHFVKNVPDELEDGVLYVSIEHATAIHKCCCGCSEEVVTPISPTDWQLTFDGKSVSLYPSVGNWSYACQSHYWIKRNEVRWAERWSQERIEGGRRAESAQRDAYYSEPDQPEFDQELKEPGIPISWCKRLLQRFFPH